MPRRSHPALAGFALILLLAGPARAGRFMTLVEAGTFAPGKGEVIQAGSLSRTADGAVRTREGVWQLGLEFGLAPSVQVGLALPAWNTVSGDAGTRSTFDGTAAWGVWNPVAPGPDRTGLSVAATVGECAEEVSAELGLVLERRLGGLTWVANAGYLHCRPHDPGEETGNHLLGRLGASRDLGRGLALAVEGEWLADHSGGLGYRAEAFTWGPALLCEGARGWVLAGLLFDPDPATTQRGGAVQVQAGVAF